MKSKASIVESSNLKNKIAFVVASVMMFVLPLLVFKFVRDNFTKDNTVVMIAVVGTVFLIKICFLIYVFCFDSLNFRKKTKLKKK